VGSIRFAPWKHISKSWAPLRCKFFVWLAIKNRCWIADRLPKRGLPHPAACPLGNQAEENIQHILISCAFTRQAWALIFQRLNLLTLAPQEMSDNFSCWWCCAIKSVPKNKRKGLNTLSILVAWELWKHQNACVFEGARPNIEVLLQSVANESTMWCLAGSSKLHELLARSLVLDH
jgi:hypothetical protein